MGEVKAIAVSFSTGRDVLNAYWGFLSNGGLVIRDPYGLREGEPVALEITIESSQQRYRLHGQVVRRPGFDSTVDEQGKAVIEFHPGEPHDLLLSAAWAETDNVPARKHKRFPTDRPVDVRLPDSGARARGRVLNVSRGGLCVHLAAPHPDLADGDRVVIAHGDATAEGRVRWARADDLGIEFDVASEIDAEKFFRLFVP